MSRPLSNTEKFIEWLLKIISCFDERFTEFKLLRNALRFATEPLSLSVEEFSQFACQFGADESTAKFEYLQLIDHFSIFEPTKEAILKKIKESSQLKLLYAKVVSIFPASYECECSFSKLNFICNRYRSRLTQDNTRDVLLMCQTAIRIDIEELVKSLNCQKSH